MYAIRDEDYDRDERSTDAESNFDMEDDGKLQEQVMSVKSVIRLGIRRQKRKSGDDEIPGNEAFRGVMAIKSNATKYCKLEFGMRHDDDTDAISLTMCLLKCKLPGKAAFCEKFRFNSCTAGMRFQNADEGKELYKVIHMKGTDVCLGYDHRYGDHIASVTNKDFIDLQSLQPFIKRVETSTELMAYIKIEMDVQINVQAIQKRKRGSRPDSDYGINFSAGPVERHFTGLEVPWLKRIRLDGIHSDVVIKTGPGLFETFDAHRCILGVQSSVFKEALLQLAGPPYELNFPHVEGSTMSLFLSLMYEDMSKISMPTDVKLIFDVMDLAAQFKVLNVINHCVQHLVRLPSSKHCVNSVLLMYLQGHIHQNSDLKFRAQQVMCEKKEMIRSPEGMQALKEFCKDHPDETAKLVLGILEVV